MRRRYLGFRVLSGSPLRSGEVYSAIIRSMLNLFGARGLSEADVKLLSFNPSNGFGILRCNHKAVWMVRAALAMVSHVGSSKASMYVVRVSGTVKALREKVRLEELS